MWDSTLPDILGFSVNLREGINGKKRFFCIFQMNKMVSDRAKLIRQIRFFAKSLDNYNIFHILGDSPWLSLDKISQSTGFAL